MCNWQESQQYILAVDKVIVQSKFPADNFNVR